MVTVSKARKILGEEARGLNDEEVEKLLNQLRALAEVAVLALEKDPKWIKTLRE